MNKKNIQILIILIAFSGTGYLLYNQFKPVPTPPRPIMGATGPLDGVASNGKPVVKIDKILPKSSTLNFKPLDRAGVVYGNDKTQAVNIQKSDVGVDKFDMFEVYIPQTNP